MRGRGVDLPVVNDNWSALETLAEVSRQIEMDEHKHDGPPHTHGMGGPSEFGRGDNLALQEQYTLDNPPVSYEQRVLRDRRGRLIHNILGKRKLTWFEASNQKFGRIESDPSIPTGFPNMSHSRSVSPNLAMAANSIAVAQASRFTPNMVDPQLLADDLLAQSISRERALEEKMNEVNADLLRQQEAFFAEPPHQPHQQQSQWPSMEPQSTPVFQQQELPNPEPEPEHQATPPPQSNDLQIAISTPLTTQFTAEYGSGQKSSKPKARSRFDQARRKEVQALRQLGACIRCRMLKKPCSTGTPCKACASVESARVWKQQCVRTRMPNALEMYSAGLHVVLASRQVVDAKAQSSFQKSLHQIEATHFPGSEIAATFSALEAHSAPSVDPGLSGDFSLDVMRLLDVEKDDPPKIIEAYMKQMLGLFIANEISNFMKITLNTAQALLAVKDDPLLTRALHFWGVVHILVDHELAWTITTRTDAEAPNSQDQQISRSTDEKTYGRLCLQLNAAAEMKASEMCKAVLGDLERRLLSKDSSESFEIFIATIIVLNCIEKSTWLFKSWEQPSFLSTWPLPKNPESFVQQGEVVADLLHQLLNIRHIPPKTSIRPEDGVIVGEEGHPAAAYYEQLQLNCKCLCPQLSATAKLWIVAHLQDKQMNHVFDQSDSRCYELRYCSRLILPPL